ncbi:DNA polymerase III delta prime subunit [hydrothermal vent metagenome]|uniref:DNA polymerase III delta prime subunit n=1 Tax=hydrothermal vent metagenome TaxID=652676 RepID=A0A3B0YS17_9ZZZZ
MPAKKTTKESISEELKSELHHSDLYPWQLADWQALRQYQTNNALPHAILLTGKKGLAKLQLAALWAKTLLCESTLTAELSSNESKACGSCPACALYQAETHPDFLFVEPSEQGKAIKVDQIRHIVEYVSLTRSRGSIRVIIISPAETMNVNAANSLLKTLEEPPENTLLILVSSTPDVLPATIRSRCQHFVVSAPTSDVLSTWLAQNNQNTAEERAFAVSLSENMPLNADFYLKSEIYAVNSDLLNDWQLLASGQAKPSKIAEKWLKQPDNIPIKLVYTWIVDMIRYRSVAHDSVYQSSASETDDNVRELFYYKRNQQLDKLAASIPLKRLFGIYDKVIDIIKLGRTSVNDQLQLESLLIQWSLIAQPSSAQSK